MALAPASPRGGPLWDVFAAGCGAGVADTIVNPLEVIKVRVQTPGQTLYRGPLDCARSILKSDGVLGLWRPGLVATWLRSYTYTATRLGLYPSVRALYHAEGADPGLLQRLAAGATTGAIASTLFSPVDLVRIRLTAEAGRRCRETGLLLTGLLAGQRPRYRHTADAFAVIARAEGVRGLWRGCSAHVMRAVTLSGSQLASYDGFKAEARALGFEEGPAVHVMASLWSGFVAQTVVMPVDTIRTRVMNDTQSMYSSPLACVRQTIAAEGFQALYRGYVPALLRQCPVMLMQMPLTEQVRRLLGLGYM